MSWNKPSGGPVYSISRFKMYFLPIMGIAKKSVNFRPRASFSRFIVHLIPLYYVILNFVLTVLSQCSLAEKDQLGPVRNSD